MTLIRPLAEANGVRLLPLPSLPDELCVAADRQRLRQVLLNLLSNAVKYNHPTGTVIVHVGQRARGRLRIAVTDTGRGIGADSLDRLFTPTNASTRPRPASRAPVSALRCHTSSSRP